MSTENPIITSEHLAGLELVQRHVSITNPLAAAQLEYLMARASAAPAPVQKADRDPAHTLFNEIRTSTPVSEDGEPVRYIVTEQQLQRIRYLESQQAEQKPDGMWCVEQLSQEIKMLRAYEEEWLAVIAALRAEIAALKSLVDTADSLLRGGRHLGQAGWRSCVEEFLKRRDLYGAKVPQQCVPDIDVMASRFLSWPLPANVCADPCASMPDYPHRTGTNLLNAEQARAMLEHVLGALELAQGFMRNKGFCENDPLTIKPITEAISMTNEIELMAMGVISYPATSPAAKLVGVPDDWRETVGMAIDLIQDLRRGTAVERRLRALLATDTAQQQEPKA